MTGPRIGSLFSGYGGLELGVQSVIGGSTAWVSDIDPGACKILAHRFPEVPNLGDITTVKWTPDCPTCGEPLALYANDAMPEGRGYYCPRDQWFDLDIRFEDPDAGRIPDPVEILTGGFPCQDVSAAGKRAGLMRGTRTGLFHEVVKAITALNPSMVVLENVRGLLSARGDTSEEYEAADNKVHLIDNLRLWVEDRRVRAVNEGRSDDVQRLTTRAHRIVGLHRRAVAARRRAERRIVRAIGTVLGALADIGYDACWYGLRAAEVGAPHGRFRIFILAYPKGNPGRLVHGDGAAAAVAADLGHERAGRTWDGWTGPTNGGLLPTPRATDGTKGGPNQRGSSGDLMLPSAVAGLLPTPTARDWKNAGDPEKTAGRMADRGQPLTEIVVNHLLPTPAVNDMGAAYTPDEWDAWTDRMKVEHGNGNGHGKSLAIEAQRLLPTPSVADSEGGHERRGGARGDELLLNGVAKEMARLLPTPVGADARGSRQSTAPNPRADNDTLSDVNYKASWGEYAAAIARWEALTRPAPAPTMTSTKGNPQLSPAFVEWMMGLPAGWVTDVPGITRNEALKALGNGVVWQQCAEALRILLPQVVAA